MIGSIIKPAMHLFQNESGRKVIQNSYGANRCYTDII